MENKNMQYERGEELLIDLMRNPEEFSKNKFKGYELLNQYLAGFPADRLVPILRADNPMIYRIGISICSELNESSCSVLLPDLLPLLTREEDPLYLHYLFSAIFNGTYLKKCGEFYHVVRYLRSQNYKLVLSAMLLVAKANNDQLKESLNQLRRFPEDKILTKGLALLLRYHELTEDGVIELIEDKNEVIQLFGGVIAQRLYDKYPQVISLGARSLNENLKRFSHDMMELNEDSDPV